MSAEDKLTITLEIRSRLDEVRLIRAALTGVLSHLRVVEADILSLELAVTEIVNNTVEHGYAGMDNQRIKVQIELQESKVEVKVIDHAQPFPESEYHRLKKDFAPLGDADEEWTPRGHGLQIVCQIVDSIAVESSPSQNVLTFSKNVAIKND